jgi:hypothetical protein
MRTRATRTRATHPRGPPSCDTVDVSTLVCASVRPDRRLRAACAVLCCPVLSCAVLSCAGHATYYAALALRPGSRGIVTDAVVPISRLAELMTQTADDVRRLGVVGPVFGHAGDGNFHTILLVCEDDEPEYVAKLHEINRLLIERTLAAGGSCTGEHGCAKRASHTQHTARRTPIGAQRTRATRPHRDARTPVGGRVRARGALRCVTARGCVPFGAQHRRRQEAVPREAVRRGGGRDDAHAQGAPPPRVERARRLSAARSERRALAVLRSAHSTRTTSSILGRWSTCERRVLSVVA